MNSFLHLMKKKSKYHKETKFISQLKRLFAIAHVSEIPF